MGSPPILRVQIHEKTFIRGDSPVEVLHKVHFDTAGHDFTVVLGPSGCGKTTLLRVIVGLETDFEGSVHVGSEKILGTQSDIGLVFQDSRVMPWATVEENIIFAIDDQPQKVVQERVNRALELVDLVEWRQELPKSLSGGMLKRLSLARALVTPINVLALDEPFSALDPELKWQLLDELLKIQQTEKFACVMVTHDTREAAYVADQVVVLGENPTTVMIQKSLIPNKPRNRKSEEFIRLANMLETYMMTNDDEKDV